MLCRRTASSLVACAPAKLNLFLRVIGRRADGYHEIETVMTTVDLYDTLIFRPSAGKDIELSVRQAACGVTDVVPGGTDNLVTRAAERLRQRFGVTEGVRITLIKRIPSAAGLGGGSSDAAVTLGALNQFWSIGATSQDLHGLAAELGSDVPFFLGPSATAVCRGRGEAIEPVPAVRGMTFVVARPPTGLSTSAVYRACRSEPAGLGAAPICRAIETGRVEELARHLRNDLQFPAERLNDDVVRLSCLFRGQPVRGHQLSGSGTAYFGVCETRRQAFAVASRLRQRGVPWVCVVQSRC